MLQNRDLGPGRYDPEYGGFSAKATEERADGPGWARQYEVARMAALPHLLHKEQWQQKKMLVIFCFFFMPHLVIFNAILHYL